MGGARSWSWGRSRFAIWSAAFPVVACNAAEKSPGSRGLSRDFEHRLPGRSDWGLRGISHEMVRDFVLLMPCNSSPQKPGLVKKCDRAFGELAGFAEILISNNEIEGEGCAMLFESS